MKWIALPTKVHLVKAVVFPVVMYGCESWTVKADHRRTDVFELWCWRRLLRVPWTPRESNQSISKGNQPWIFIGSTGPEALASWLTGKDPDSGKDWGQEEKGTTGDKMPSLTQWIASPTQWTWVWASSGRWWWTGKPGMLPSMGLQRVRHNWATKLNCDCWTLCCCSCGPSTPPEGNSGWRMRYSVFQGNWWTGL